MHSDSDAEMEPSEDEKDTTDPMVLAGLLNPINDSERKFLILYPNDRTKLYWDFSISIILLLSCYITPINLAFSDLENNESWVIFLLFIDVLQMPRNKEQREAILKSGKNCKEYYLRLYKKQ